MELIKGRRKKREARERKGSIATVVVWGFVSPENAHIYSPSTLQIICRAAWTVRSLIWGPRLKTMESLSPQQPPQVTLSVTQGACCEGKILDSSFFFNATLIIFPNSPPLDTALEP